MLTLRQLEVFQAIAREGSMTRAARCLHLSQPAVSMALSEMERILGGRVFDRFGKSLRLNERGRHLLPRAMAILDQTHEVESQLARGGAPLEGELSIGASSTIANYLMPDILGRFNAGHPGIRISMMVGNSSDIVRMIDNLSLDIGFIAGECRNPMIEVMHWKEDRLTVFGAPHHPLSAKKTITARMLQDESWVLREHGSGTRATLEHAISGKIENLQIAMELGQSEAVKHAVENSRCISCLSQFVIARELQDGRLVQLPIQGVNLQRNLYIISHKEKYQGNLTKRFLQEVASFTERWQTASETV